MSASSKTDYLGYTYGAVVYFSGLGGFLVDVKKNKMSLILGTVFGGLGLAGAYQATEQPDEPLIALANAGILSSVQIIRNIKEVKTRVPIRGLPITILSLAMFTRYSYNLYKGITEQE